jgi:hypothetical protein
MINDYINNLIEKEIQKKYELDKKLINKSKDDSETFILNKYIKEYPLRILSIYHLKNFRKKLLELEFLPEIAEYTKMAKSDEIFDGNMFLLIQIGQVDHKLQIPFFINISKLSRYLENKNFAKQTFLIPDLLKNISDEYDDEEVYKEKKEDIVYDEKKRNPIIIMNGSKVNDFTIINGNHRILHYAKEGKTEIEGYFVTIKAGYEFAVTKDYKELYKILSYVIRKVKGSIDIEKLN